MQYNDRSCVHYEYLTPAALQRRIEDCPVAYLCLGTLEWHGPHLPLGTDALQGRDLFRLAAEQWGGVVIPPLYLGPDRAASEDGKDYYGMEIYLESIRCPRPYPLTQLPGNAFWLPEEVFDAVLSGMIRQLARIGFKVFMATGHGPSMTRYRELTPSLEAELGIRMTVVDPEGCETRFIYDHAAESETSNMLYFYPEQVHMDDLPVNWQETVVGISGNDPKQYGSAENLEKRLPIILERIQKNVRLALDELSV